MSSLATQSTLGAFIILLSIYDNITILRSLLLTEPAHAESNRPDARQDAVQVAPRHAVRFQWDAAALDAHSVRTEEPVYGMACEDRIRGRDLVMMRERLAVATKPTGQRSMGDLHKLPDWIEVSVGARSRWICTLRRSYIWRTWREGQYTYEIILQDEKSVARAPDGRFAHACPIQLAGWC